MSDEFFTPLRVFSDERDNWGPGREPTEKEFIEYGRRKGWLRPAWLETTAPNGQVFQGYWGLDWTYHGQQSVWIGGVK